MVAVGGQFQNRKKRGELFIASLRRGKPHVVIARPPRQQPRLLKHHAYPCACRTDDTALIVVVEAGDDLQHGSLAAAGWADKYANLSGAKRKVEIDEHVVPFAGRICERLACDFDLKLHVDATLIAGFQTAVPGRFRWRTPPLRKSAHTLAEEGGRIAERRSRSRSQRDFGVR